MELITNLFLPLAIVIASFIGASAYKKQKVYESKERFYLSFLADMLKLLRKTDKQNMLLEEMKEFLDKHGPDITIYATPKFKIVFERNFRTTNSQEKDDGYPLLVSMSILIEEAKKDLGTKSNSIEEVLANLAVYMSTNDIREQDKFISALEEAHSHLSKYKREK